MLIMGKVFIMTLCTVFYISLIKRFASADSWYYRQGSVRDPIPNGKVLKHFEDSLKGEKSFWIIIGQAG